MTAMIQEIQPSSLGVTVGALAAALSDPQRTAAADDDALHVLREAWNTLVTQHTDDTLAELGLGELQPTIAHADALCRWLALPMGQREQAYLKVFGLLISRQCPPYETEYCHWKDPTYRAHQLADIAGFYNAHGIEPNHERPERPDHVGLELEFAALLLLKVEVADRSQRDGAEICRRTLASFLRDHVIWWMPTFARCMQQRIASLPSDDTLVTLSAVAVALRAWVAAARIASGVEPSRQIIAPQVEPQTDDDSCGSCSTC